MQRVRLQTSNNASNSRAMSSVGNLDDNMVHLSCDEYEKCKPYQQEKVKVWQTRSAKELIWIKKWRGYKQKSPRIGRGLGSGDGRDPGQEARHRDQAKQVQMGA